MTVPVSSAMKRPEVPKKEVGEKMAALRKARKEPEPET
jgi:hypothetical protein